MNQTLFLPNWDFGLKNCGLSFNIKSIYRYYVNRRMTKVADYAGDGNRLREVLDGCDKFLNEKDLVPDRQHPY